MEISQTISISRLINPAIIKKENIIDIINIVNNTNVHLKINTNSLYIDYPIIENIFIKDIIDIKSFYSILFEISKYLIPYNNIKNSTLFDIYIKTNNNINNKIFNISLYETFYINSNNNIDISFYNKIVTLDKKKIKPILNVKRLSKLLNKTTHNNRSEYDGPSQNHKWIMETDKG